MKTKTNPPESTFHLLSAHPMGWAAAIARFAERIGVVEWLNAVLPWDPAQCHLSPGLRLLALMIGFLVDPRALYQMEEFYQTMDCEVLFGPGVQAGDFNDDALSRPI